MSALYFRSRDVLWRNAGDRVVLRRLDGGELVSLEGSGTLLWKLLEKPISLDDVVVEMATHYGVDVAMVREAVTKAIDELEAVGLVSSAEPTNADRVTPRHAVVSRLAAVEEAAQ